jgi:hypothetical protein
MEQDSKLTISFCFRNLYLRADIHIAKPHIYNCLKVENNKSMCNLCHHIGENKNLTIGT